MFLNMTGETCTGTGDVLTLTGALAGHNAFGKTGNAEDGGLYSCVVADADGVTKVAGVYTFDKTANTFTRNDSWNSTASAVDKNPSTNIALSAGTHTIKCDTVAQSEFRVKRGDYSDPATGDHHVGDGAGGAACWNNGPAPVPDRIHTEVFTLTKPTKISSLLVRISTGDQAATRFIMGIYDTDAEGRPRNLVATTADMSSSVGVAGTKTQSLVSPVRLGAGTYYQATVTDSSILRYYTMNAEDMDSPMLRSFASNGGNLAPYMSGVTGALPAEFILNGSNTASRGPIGLQ